MRSDKGQDFTPRGQRSQKVRNLRKKTIQTSDSPERLTYTNSFKASLASNMLNSILNQHRSVDPPPRPVNPRRARLQRAAPPGPDLG